MASTVLGSAVAQATHTAITISIDRTAKINSLPPSETFDVHTEVSFDGGATWHFISGTFGVPCGPDVDPKTGVVRTAHVEDMGWWGPMTPDGTYTPLTPGWTHVRVLIISPALILPTPACTITLGLSNPLAFL